MPNLHKFKKPVLCCVGLGAVLNSLWAMDALQVQDDGLELELGIYMPKEQTESMDHEAQNASAEDSEDLQDNEQPEMMDSHPDEKNSLDASEDPDFVNTANRTLIIDAMGKSKPVFATEDPKKHSPITEVRLSGLVEIEAYWQKESSQASKSDLEVATAQLNFSGRLNPQVEAFMSLLYEEPEGGIGLDVAKIEWKECLHPQLSLSVGKDYLAFNNYDTLLISDPLVLVLTEASETNLKVTWQQSWAHYSFTVFNGDNKNRGEQLNNFVIESGIQPCPGFSGSISYISNIFESDTLQDDLSATGQQKVGGFNGFTRFNLGDLSLLSEFTIASRNVNPGELVSTKYECKPQAYRLEADYALSETLDMGLVYEGSSDYQPLPEVRYGAVARQAIKNNFGLGLEVLQNEGQNNSDYISVRGQVRLTF